MTPIFIISAVVTPFFGFIIDKIGKIGYFMLTSLILFLCSHILFVVFPENIEIIYALIPMIIMGLFYATYAAVFWPCIPLVVDKRLVGTAYGVVNSIQNIFLTICPLIYGAIKDKHSDYIASEYFIIGLILGGIIFSIIINILDTR